MQKEDESIVPNAPVPDFSEPCPPPAHFHVFMSQNWVTDTLGSKGSWKFRDLAPSLYNRGRLGRKGIKTGTELPSQQCFKSKENLDPFQSHMNNSSKF